MRKKSIAQAKVAHPGVGAEVQTRMATVVVAALLGVFLLWGVGFAQPQVLHNAAHDARHAFSFPCH
jgi:cobalt transporter subunit CbtB